VVRFRIRLIEQDSIPDLEDMPGDGMVAGPRSVPSKKCSAMGTPREERDGVVLIATPRPDSPELTTSADLLVGLEDYPDRNAFAGRGYPQVPCTVPEFDLSETVILRTTGGSDRVH
jgi:hypothetical protein